MPKVVCRPKSIRLDDPREQKFVTDALELFEKTRRDMGYAAHGSYVRGSWMWQRAVATRRYADDFSDRLSLPANAPTSKLWKASNRSLNLPSVVIDQHKAKLGRDFNPEGTFLALKPDGPEDASFILKPAEQYLQKQAAKKRLGKILRNDVVDACLIRGESILKIVPNHTTRTVKEKVRILLHPKLDGAGTEPALDSKGGFITEKDLWMDHSDDPTLEVLQRDPVTQRPKGGQPIYSDQPREVNITVAEPAGADISAPFWADFGATMDAPNLDIAACKFHLFEMHVDDLFDMLPKHLLNKKAADEYYALASQPAGGDTNPMRAEASFPLYKQGEDQSPGGAGATATLPNDLGRRLYAEVWLRYDLDDDRHREDLRILIDVAAQWPIAYDHAHEVLGNPARRHPFSVDTILPEEKRWYGRGYYSKYGDLAEEIDADFNRITIELAKSGNLIFEKRDATEQGRAGMPIAFRSPATFKLTDQNTGKDAVSVITVNPVVQDLQTRLEFNLTAFMGRVGGVTPGDTEGQQLAANTATGLQILQEVKNDHVEARYEELKDGPTNQDGLTGIVRTFAELELLLISESQVRQQFGASRIETGQMIPLTDPATGTPVLQPAPVDPLAIVDNGSPSLAMVPAPQTIANSGEAAQPSPTIAPPPLEPVLVPETVETATALLDWARSLTPQQIHDRIALVFTRSRSNQIIQTNENIIKLAEKWLSMPPALQAALKNTFIEMLLALEVSDPATLLDSLQAAAADPLTQQSILAAQGIDDPASLHPAPESTPKDPKENPPITGRPDPQGPGTQSPPPHPTL